MATHRHWAFQLLQAHSTSQWLKLFNKFFAFKKTNDIFKLYHNCYRLEAHEWLTASKFLMHMLWKYEVNSLLWHAVESKCLYFIHTWESLCMHRMLTHSCWGGAEQDSSSNTLLFAKVSESFKAMKEFISKFILARQILSLHFYRWGMERKILLNNSFSCERGNVWH